MRHWLSYPSADALETRRFFNACLVVMLGQAIVAIAGSGKPRLWCSLDGNFWFGGVTSLRGIANPTTRQTSSRIGVTASVPLSKHQSMKISYNDGAYIRFGGNYHTVSVAWQYSWIGRHE